MLMALSEDPKNILRGERDKNLHFLAPFFSKSISACNLLPVQAPSSNPIENRMPLGNIKQRSLQTPDVVHQLKA